MKTGQALGILLVCLLPAVVSAETFKSDKGYQFDPPPGWARASEAELAPLREQLSKGGAGGTLDTMFYRGPWEDRKAVIGIAVAGRAAPVEASRLGGVEKGLLEGQRGTGATVSVTQSHVIHLVDRDYYSITWDASVAGSPEAMRTWSLMTCGGGKTYFFSFMSLASDWAKDEQVFKAATQTIVVHGTPATPGSDRENEPGYRAGQMIAEVLLVVGVVWLVVWFIRRRTRPVDRHLPPNPL